MVYLSFRTQEVSVYDGRCRNPQVNSFFAYHREYVTHNPGSSVHNSADEWCWDAVELRETLTLTQRAQTLFTHLGITSLWFSMEGRWDSKGRFYSYLDDTRCESYHYIIFRKIDTLIVYFLHNVRVYTIPRLVIVNTIIPWKKNDFIDFIDVSSSWLIYLRFPSIQYSVASSLYWPVFVITLKSTAENINCKQGVYSILSVADNLGRRHSVQKILECTAYKLRGLFDNLQKC